MREPIIQELSELDVLISENNMALKSIVKAKIDAQVLSSVEPTTVVAQKEGTDPSGKKVVKNITAGEMIDDANSDMQAYKARLKAIDVIRKQSERKESKE